MKEKFNIGFINQCRVCGPARDCEASRVQHEGRRGYNFFSTWGNKPQKSPGLEPFL